MRGATSRPGGSDPLPRLVSMAPRAPRRTARRCMLLSIVPTERPTLRSPSAARSGTQDGVVALLTSVTESTLPRGRSRLLDCANKAPMR